MTVYLWACVLEIWGEERGLQTVDPRGISKQECACQTNFRVTTNQFDWGEVACFGRSDNRLFGDDDDELWNPPDVQRRPDQDFPSRGEKPKCWPDRGVMSGRVEI